MFCRPKCYLKVQSANAIALPHAKYACYIALSDTGEVMIGRNVSSQSRLVDQIGAVRPFFSNRFSRKSVCGRAARCFPHSDLLHHVSYPHGGLGNARCNSPLVPFRQSLEVRSRRFPVPRRAPFLGPTCRAGPPGGCAL